MSQPHTFHLTISTKEQTIYEADISSLVAPAQDGYVGILANHAPYLTALASGKIIIKNSQGENLNYQLKGQGFLEVLHNNASLLAYSLTETSPF